VRVIKTILISAAIGKVTPLGVAAPTAAGGTGASGTLAAVPACPATRPPPRRKNTPPRSQELAHMSLDRLRAYRRTLLSEELRTSYWRRLLQARRDLLRAPVHGADLGSLRDALTEERGTGGRQAILALHPDGGMPILPALPDLWASEVTSRTLVDGRELAARLASAESVLSSYREALHRRLDRATADLVARYHEDPRLCFVAIPKVD
jgi:hypothetical protein